MQDVKYVLVTLGSYIVKWENMLYLQRKSNR